MKQMLGNIAAIPAIRRPMQEDLKFEVSLGYIARLLKMRGQVLGTYSVSRVPAMEA